MDPGDGRRCPGQQAGGDQTDHETESPAHGPEYHGASMVARSRRPPSRPSSVATGERPLRAPARAQPPAPRQAQPRADRAVGQPPRRGAADRHVAREPRAAEAEANDALARVAPAPAAQAAVGAAAVELPALDRVGDGGGGDRRHAARATGLRSPPAARRARRPPPGAGSASTVRTSAIRPAQLVSPALSVAHEAPHHRRRAVVAVAERRDVDRVRGLHERRAREARRDLARLRDAS